MNLVTVKKGNLYDEARKPIWPKKWRNLANCDMVHTENFVLVDAKKVRGFMTDIQKQQIIF
jgi:hypothetical protein